jgi:5-methylcytosine-specific restriction endonuclease McrA
MPFNDEAPTDAEIRERDGGKCARCGGNTGGLHIHHRWMRSAGADERACNRVTLCAMCHNFVHMHPGISIDEGWLLSRYNEPAEVEVKHFLWPSWPVLLEEGGGFTPVIDDE